MIPLFWELISHHSKRRKTCLEGDRIWNTDGKVCEHRKELVRFYTAKSEVVRNLMDSEEKIVVGCSANSICSQDKRERNRMSSKNTDEEPRSEKLDRDHSKHDVFCQGLVSHEFRDLDR